MVASVVVLPDVELEPEPVVVALLAPERRSRPAVIVTVARLSEMSLTIADVVPGSFASDPAMTSVQSAVWEVMAQSKSIVLNKRSDS